MNRWKKEQKPKPSRFEDTAGQTENFATRNVRLITFLICIGVFLVVFIPIGVIGISQYRDWLEADDLPQMTINDVVRFSEKEGQITLAELTAYKGDLQEDSTYDAVFTAEFDRYHVRAVANKVSGVVEVFVLLDTETGARYDVLKDDLLPLFKFGES